MKVHDSITYNEYKLLIEVDTSRITRERLNMTEVEEAFLLEYFDIPRADIQHVIMRKILPYPETWTVCRVSPDLCKQYKLLINIRIPSVKAFYMKSSLFYYIYAKDIPLSFRKLL